MHSRNSIGFSPPFTRTKQFEKKSKEYKKLADEFQKAVKGTEITRKKAPLKSDLTLTSTPGGVAFRLAEVDIKWITQDDDLKPKTEDDPSDFNVFAYPGNKADAYEKTYKTSSGKTGERKFVIWLWGNLGQSKINVGEEDEEGKGDIRTIRVRSDGTTEEDAVKIVTEFNSEEVRKAEQHQAEVDLILDSLSLAASVLALVAVIIVSALLVKVAIVAGIIIAFLGLISWMTESDPPCIKTTK